MTTPSVANSSSSKGLYHGLGVVLAIAVFLNTSVGYIPPSSGGFSFASLSQKLFWLILAVSVSVAATYSYRIAIFSCLLTVTAILFNVLAAAEPSVAPFLLTYRLCYSVIIAMGSAIIYLKWSPSHTRFVKFVIYGSVPVLLVQLLGISEAAHVLNTNTGFELGRIELSPTFLVPFNELTIKAVYGQLRPSGLFYANAIAAVFAIFAIAYRLSQRLTRVAFYDVCLVYATLLMMAKITIVFLVVGLVVKYAISKNKTEIATVKRFALMACTLLLLHLLLFPGVVQTALSAESFYASSGIRIVDFLQSMNIDVLPMAGVSLSEFGTTQLSMNYARADEVPGDYSGIGILLLLSPLVILLWRAVKKREKRLQLTPQDRRTTGFLILALTFAFLASPVLGTPLIAYLVGPVLVPLLRKT